VHLPLFTLFTLRRDRQLWEALRAAGPVRAWALMSELAALDRPLHDACAEPDQTAAHVEAQTRAFMELAPALDEETATAAARRFATYGPRLQLESTFLSLWLSDDRTLFQDVVEIRGLEHLVEAQRRGGVLALPLHLGPSYAVPLVLAHLAPTRFVYNRMNVADLRDVAFPDLDVEAFPVDDAVTFRRGLEALRAGQVFAMFPEFDPRGQGLRHARVPFLGTTVLAPEGPVLLSRAARVPMLPIVLDSDGGGHFTLRFLPPVPPPLGDTTGRQALESLWRVVESQLLDGRVGDWEMWIEFDLMSPRRGEPT